MSAESRTPSVRFTRIQDEWIKETSDDGGVTWRVVPLTAEPPVDQSELPFKSETFLTLFDEADE